MKTAKHAILLFRVRAFVVSCAGRRHDRFNTQRGAVIGAGVGAVAGHMIGRDSRGALIGAGVGTLVGALVGNAVDQEHEIAREAAMQNKRIVYYDPEEDHKIEAVPGPEDQQTKCRKVTKRVWDKGYLVSESTEEICEGEKISNVY